MLCSKIDVEDGRMQRLRGTRERKIKRHQMVLEPCWLPGIQRCAHHMSAGQNQARSDQKTGAADMFMLERNEDADNGAPKGFFKNWHQDRSAFQAAQCRYR
uniref:Uncharacterized protein n=1 Tax=Thermogemmatispora argillosa TaxID=2045280 RepID=A0A455T8Y2_9CHLR|nr:hypothetical protein KTA_40980 [Thermogemmatispora argillosa]